MTSAAKTTLRELAAAILGIAIASIPGHFLALSGLANQNTSMIVFVSVGPFLVEANSVAVYAAYTLCGLTSGYLAAWYSRSRPFLHAAIYAVLTPLLVTLIMLMVRGAILAPKILFTISAAVLAGGLLRAFVDRLTSNPTLRFDE